jgi:hypothetical protein
MSVPIITSIVALPGSPYNGSEKVGIIITSGVPSFFKITGDNLDRIVSVSWYPKNLGSVQFTIRNVILVNKELATFMVMVTDNFLHNHDRAGHLSFRFDDNTVSTAPVITYGHVSIGPLWTAPGDGLNTG